MQLATGRENVLVAPKGDGDVRRKITVVLSGLALVVLAACDTQPATDVNQTQATLNAKGACTAGTSGVWWYQMRDYTNNGGWWNATPQRGYSCQYNSGEVNFEPQRVSGLQPDTIYQFRLATTVNGEFIWWDSGGTKNGGWYDSFRTASAMYSKEVYPAPPPEAVDTTACTATEVCSSAIRKKKEDLKTVYESWFRAPLIPDFEWWGARVTTDWGYTLGPYNIRWRRSEADMWISSPYGGVTKQFEDWYTSKCEWIAGQETCLTRREYQVRLLTTIVTPVGPLFINSYQWGCLGTRIRGNGSHTRRVWGGRCSDPPDGSASATRAHRTPQPQPDPPKGKPGIGIEEFVSGRMRQQIKEACWRRPESHLSAECKRVLLRAYNTLTPRQQRIVSGLNPDGPNACAAVSPRTRKALGGSSCESMKS